MEYLEKDEGRYAAKTISKIGSAFIVESPIPMERENVFLIHCGMADSLKGLTAVLNALCVLKREGKQVSMIVDTLPVSYDETKQLIDLFNMSETVSISTDGQAGELDVKEELEILDVTPAYILCKKRGKLIYASQDSIADALLGMMEG